MAKFASETSVSIETSRNEIERTIGRYGADAFGFTTDGRRSTIAFRMAGRHFRFSIEMPDPQAREFTHVRRNASTVAARTEAQRRNAYDQAIRQRWRALALVIKAKLEAVDAGIVSLEDEFLAQTVLPDGQTVSEWAQPQLAVAYQSGAMPTQLQITGPSR